MLRSELRPRSPLRQAMRRAEDTTATRRPRPATGGTPERRLLWQQRLQAYVRDLNHR